VWDGSFRPEFTYPCLKTSELGLTAMETRPFMVFLCPIQLFHNSHIYIHESYDSSQGESDVRTNISMVIIPHDGDNVGHYILRMLESLVEDIIMETKCLILTS